MTPLGRLHLITDVRRDRDPVAVVRAALSVGVPVVQVRLADHVSDLGAYELASVIVALCREAGATCLVNDRLHIALAVGAHGGHVGGDDLPVEAARRVLGPDAILGATARDPAAGQRAVSAGASYLGVGPAFATTTKDGLPDPIGAAGVGAVAAAVAVPVIAIGSVTAARIPALLAAGAYGVAVVSAVSDAADPARAAAELLAQLPAAELPARLPAAELPARLPAAELSARLPAAELSARLPAAELPARLPAAEPAPIRAAPDGPA
jgi:thiamine-phosphate pyrophosphorylase